MTIPLYFRVFWQLNNNNKLRAINFKSRLRLYNGGMPDIKRLRIESRPLWKPMHLQPVYEMNPSYTNGVSESLFTQGLCLPSGPCVTDEDVAYIVAEIKNCIKN